MKNLSKSALLAMVLCLMPESGLTAGLKVENAWVRMPPPVSDTAAAYLELNNPTHVTIKVKSVSSSVSNSAEFHSMMMHGEMMHMMKMDNVQIEQGSSLVFSPNGNHLMLMDLKAPLNAGDHVMIQIVEEDGTMHEVHAEVKDMRHSSHNHEGHDHHGQNH